MPPESKRVTLVADELLGYVKTGGLGTATTYLAITLARMGHDVELLYVGRAPTAPLRPEWARLYGSEGVRIRILERSRETVEPSFFARMRDTELALRADPPDVVITQDLAAPAYTALRQRRLGLAFDSTLFVVYCHGTRQWISDVSRKVRVLPGALAVSVLERQSVELADVVVAPSAYVVDWMRSQGWRLPTSSVVIRHLTRAAVINDRGLHVATSDQHVRRLAFFGRLEERKGLQPFLAGVNALDPRLLDGVELLFIGRSTPAWPPDRIETTISEPAKAALRGISFETDLDQDEALEQLALPGTLAVMPSFAETFGNTVRECLDYGIPFIASNAAAIVELVAPEDRERVLFEPTPEGVEASLRRALGGEDALHPVRAAFDTAESVAAWEEVLARAPGTKVERRPEPEVDVVIVGRRSPQALGRCLNVLAAQRYPRFRAIVVTTRDPVAGEMLPELGNQPPLRLRADGTSVEAARQTGLEAASAPFVVFLDEDDEPAEELLETLVRAQAASGADVVGCGLRVRGENGTPTLHFFLGEPGGLGLLSNSYGSVALIRRTLVDDLATSWPVEGDADWPLLARLSLAGARIVSVPAPLVTRGARPGTIDRHPSDALLVVEQVERTLPSPLRSTARLAAGLAAAAGTRRTGRPSTLRRALRRLTA
jgi:glycosyltransferase involved in cell wall biosynthesis